MVLWAALRLCHVQYRCDSVYVFNMILICIYCNVFMYYVNINLQYSVNNSIYIALNGCSTTYRVVNYVEPEEMHVLIPPD